MKNAQKKIPIIGTGLSGLVGSRIVELLSTKYDFKDLSLDSGIDIRQKRAVSVKIKNSPAKIILHLAAKTDVDSCEKEKNLAENSQAWQINVLGTKNIVESARESGKKVIYFSTDFVFDGENGPYSEEDEPNPINFYAQTKFEGEKIVQTLDNSWIIMRISYPYRSNFPRKKDLIRTMMDRLSRGEIVAAVNDQFIVPTFIDDIAYALDLLITNRETGIYHVVGSQAVTPYYLARLIKEKFKLSGEVKPTSLADYYKDRAKRPRKSILKNDKIKSLGAKLRGVEEGLTVVKKQISH